MTNAVSPDVFMGRTAVDPEGNKIGSVGQVYVNDQSGVPDWITVNTGLFGMRENFVAAAGVQLQRRRPGAAVRQGCGQGRPGGRRRQPSGRG